MKIPFFCILTFLVFNSCEPAKTPQQTKKAEVADFIGQWSLEIEGNWVGWLEVRQEDGYLDGELLWKWGSVMPVAHIYLQNDRLIVTRVDQFPRKTDEGGQVIRSQTPTFTLEVMRDGEFITGGFMEPSKDGLSVDTTGFKGIKLPPITSTPDLTGIKYGEPVSLFNGIDLKGWTLTNDGQVNGFKVIDGILLNDPIQPEGGQHLSYGNLKTESKFEDFNLKLEVNVPAGSNSGIYLRGIYEVQVLDSYGKQLDSHNMGGLYSRITPSVQAEKPAGEWQSLDITLFQRHVTIVLNGITIVDNKPVYGPTGGALHADVSLPGPIYLQGDHGKVSYRNLVLTPIKNDR